MSLTLNETFQSGVKMNKILIVTVFACSILSSPVFGLDSRQMEEMKRTVKNMQALMPRRVDQMTTITSTWMKDKTWYINATINTGGRNPNEKTKRFLKSYIRDQYCRPPYEYLDAGLVITTQYFDENNKFIVAASASRSICGR